MNDRIRIQAPLLAALIITLLLALPHPAPAEFIFLKNGDIREGTIVGEMGATVSLRKPDKKIEVVPRAIIMRVLYTELYMGKVFVQKIDGKGVTAFMVDEDRKSYTFRNELYKPEEFTLKREEVLFIARRNPSGLEAEPGTDRVSLKWHKPYNPVRHYKVYLKGPKDDSFLLAGETGSRSYTAGGLKSNTAYLLRVTAVDTENEESHPSNEVKAVTLNIRPDAPGGFEQVRQPVKGPAKHDTLLRWRPAADPDGTVKAYAVFKKGEKGYERVATVEKAEYALPGLDSRRSHHFAVRSIDDRGGESDDADYLMGYEYGLAVRGWYLSPRGDFGELFGAGFGTMLELSVSNLFVEYFGIGVLTGGAYLSNRHEKVDHSVMVPFLAGAFYRYQAYRGLSLTPYLYTGYSYHRVSYTGVAVNPLYVEKTDTGYLLTALGGMRLGYTRGLWFAELDCGYGGLVQEDGVMQFVSLAFGLGYRM